MSRGAATVFSVLYHVDDDDPRAYGGAFGDGSFIARFRSEARAAAFARGRTYYGRPAEVQREDNVPARILARWNFQ